jgi:hypothetical protein
MDPEAVPKRWRSSPSRRIGHPGGKCATPKSPVCGRQASPTAHCSSSHEGADQPGMRSSMRPYRTLIACPNVSGETGGATATQRSARVWCRLGPPFQQQPPPFRDITTPSGLVSPSLSAPGVRQVRLGTRNSLFDPGWGPLGAPPVNRNCRLLRSGQWISPPAAPPARRTALRRLAQGRGRS